MSIAKTAHLSIVTNNSFLLRHKLKLTKTEVMRSYSPYSQKK